LRKDGLENYLRTILNEKMYLVTPVFEFIELNANISEFLRVS
jgi:hypothetical protein